MQFLQFNTGRGEEEAEEEDRYPASARYSIASDILTFFCLFSFTLMNSTFPPPYKLINSATNTKYHETQTSHLLNAISYTRKCLVLS